MGERKMTAIGDADPNQENKMQCGEEIKAAAEV